METEKETEMETEMLGYVTSLSNICVLLVFCSNHF